MKQDKVSLTRDVIRVLCKRPGRSLNIEHVLNELGKDYRKQRTSVSTILSRLLKEGRVKSPRRGLYNVESIKEQAVEFTCQCCGFKQEFKGSLPRLGAYDAGWDTPPTFRYVCCNLCPGICIVLKAGHSKAHALWAKEGRPTEFTVEKCAIDTEMDHIN